MRKYDKSLMEVWQWKEDVYEDVKDLNNNEYIEKIRCNADKILSENTIKLTPIYLKKEHQNTKE
jgi:hypothetical protein